MMPGRRYSEGLHQALEAKEHQPIQPENQTLASITFQNYFRMYEKLAGMTGTALTEADEFLDIYNLEVLEVPTNMPLARLDEDDEVYRTNAEKYRSIITLLEECKLRGQPVLVGTTSIEKSEQLADMLRERGWEKHDFSDPNAFAALYSGDESATHKKVFAVLNARYHEQEAKIIAQAGVPGAITIATNMAGRGTDIQLGGNTRSRTYEGGWVEPYFADEAVSRKLIDEFLKEAERQMNRQVDEAMEAEQRLAAKSEKTNDEDVSKRRAALARQISEQLSKNYTDTSDDPKIDELKRKLLALQAEVARLKEKALLAGGLFVLGTERHESRRIDNQLRGRSGRQGDPGRSKFFLSLEDDLMRIFGSDKLDGMLTKLGLKENEAIVHPWINKALEKAQQKVEARNFDLRKNILKFDNVMNDQRKVIFEQRVDWMRDENVAEIVTDMRHAVIDTLVAKHVPENAYPEQWDTPGLKEELNRVLGLDVPVDVWAKEEGIADEELTSRIDRQADEHMAAKVAQWGPDVIRYVEKSILLQTLDHLWREHLLMLEHLRQVIGLRGYGQRDPLNEYKAEAFSLFEALSNRLREAVTAQLMRVEIVQEQQEEQQQQPQQQNLPYMEAHKIDPNSGDDEMAFADASLAPAMAGNGNGTARALNPNDPTSWGKVKRNEPCPCGSGKKYKHCHGRFG
jgi:preprotein translocase subunit SecA